MSSVPQLSIDDILNCIKSSVRVAKSEEDVRVRVSNCIEDKILKPLGLNQYSGRYEYTLVTGARVDALYGHVIIEYKAPGKLSSVSDVAKAKEQVIKYIMTEASSKDEWNRYLGVIISDRIAFVKYYKPQDQWILRGPYDINREVVIKLVEALRGLRRKALSVNNIVGDFGPKSDIAKKSVKVLYDKLMSPGSPRTKVLFDDWMRLFKQTTGYNPERLRELPELAREYGLSQEVNFDALIFAIQTYYAFIMKLLAAEVTYLYGGGKFYKSYIAELDDAYTRSGVDGLRDKLRELESGGIFRQFGIENFLEGDYFSWYLEGLDKNLADVLAEIARRLAEYEPATPQLEPEHARDLLKRLYQELVPRDIRHNLGEYYTPDWLADFILDEVGLSLDNLMKIGEQDSLKPLQIRVLDPACGSGTFLVRYIARLRAYAAEHFLEDRLIDYLVQNVVGYDLNPLAVLTARTNYLLMIADLPKTGNIEIPVYLADSLMVEKRSTIMGNVYIFKTVVGEFQVPMNVVDKGLLSKILVEVSNALRNKYSPKEFEDKLRHDYKELTNSDVNILTNLYKVLLRLKEEGKDDVWIPIIRNAFAPAIKGVFDFVVGNPPWVNWENLPKDYREMSKELWEQYGIIGRGKGLGKVKRDLAMLFMARTFDLYLRPGGKQGFLMPLTIFKTQAGAGFREFLFTKTKICAIDDMVTLYPFEEATNRTSIIIIEKPQKPDEAVVENSKGIRNIVWINKLGNKPIPTDMPLEDVFKVTERYNAVIMPIIESDPASHWMQTSEEVLPYMRKIISGTQYYEARAGIYTALNNVYYIQIKARFPDGNLMITNPSETGQKKSVKQVEMTVESDLVYPLIRGRDVKKWYIDYKDRYIIVPHDPKTAKPFPETTLKTKYPKTYEYLNTFRKELEGRSIHKLWGKGNPFYSVYDIGPYSFAPYKVVWKRIAGAITGKATSFECAVIEPLETKYLEVKKPVVPDDSIILIPVDNPNEAYYIAGILNSTIARSIIASYTYELRQETHIANIIRIPKFNTNNEIHIKIAELSKRAHEIAKCIYAKNKSNNCEGIRDLESELKKVEDEIDKAVARLYGMPEDTVKMFRKLLDMLTGEEIAEEKDESEVIVKPSIDFTKTEVIADQADFIEVNVSTAGLCDRTELVIEAPWGSHTFDLGDGKHKIEVNLPEGVFDVKYTFKCSDYSTSGVVKVTSSKATSTGPKRPRTLKLG